MNPLLRNLPGADLVSQGLEDLEQGNMTAPAYLLLCASERLTRLGLRLPSQDALPPSDASGPAVELLLYAALQKDCPLDAYRRYNSLRRELSSFVHAAERSQRR